MVQTHLVQVNSPRVQAYAHIIHGREFTKEEMKKYRNEIRTASRLIVEDLLIEDKDLP